jgi:hypothetical protein
MKDGHLTINLNAVDDDVDSFEASKNDLSTESIKIQNKDDSFER